MCYACKLAGSTGETGIDNQWGVAKSALQMICRQLYFCTKGRKGKILTCL